MIRIFLVFEVSCDQSRLSPPEHAGHDGNGQDKVHPDAKICGGKDRASTCRSGGTDVVACVQDVHGTLFVGAFDFDALYVHGDVAQAHADAQQRHRDAEEPH